MGSEEGGGEGGGRGNLRKEKWMEGAGNEAFLLQTRVGKEGVRGGKIMS